MREKFLIFLCLIFVCAEAWRKGDSDAKRPSYIPENYYQIEANDFKDYFEWWGTESSEPYQKHLLLSSYDKPLKEYKNFFSKNDFKDNIHSQIFPMHSEKRYFFLKTPVNSKGESEHENYDLLFLNNDKLVLVTASNGDTNPSGNEHAFFCRKWFVVNETHALDTENMYNIGVEQNTNKHNLGCLGHSNSLMPKCPTVLIKDSLIQPIDTIKNDNCFTTKIKKQLDQCFNKNKYCVVEITNGKPELFVSDDHIIHIHKGVQLIMKLYSEKGFKDMPYYLLKDVNGDMFYFPKQLKTSSDHYENMKTDAFRVSILPRSFEGAHERFWKKWEKKHENDPTVQPTSPTPPTPGPSIQPIPDPGQGIWGAGWGNQIIFNNPNIYINDLYSNVNDLLYPNHNSLVLNCPKQCIDEVFKKSSCPSSCPKECCFLSGKNEKKESNDGLLLKA